MTTSKPTATSRYVSCHERATLAGGQTPAIELGGVVERAMGIEPTGKALPDLENKRFRANADAKCD